ncbi:MAG: HEAT repeat domain-containing protein [Anaerolineales bacterium]
MAWLFGDSTSRARRLVAQLGDPQKSAQAETELLQLGKDAVPALLEALQLPQPALRARAAEVLIRLGPLATPQLIAQLNTASPPVQLQICQIFAQTRPREALPALLGALRSPSQEVRIQAAKTIGGIGDASVLPSLIRLTKDADPGVRVAAVLAMSYFPQSTSTLKDVLLEDAKIEVRQAAARALTRLRDPSTLPALIEALQDGRWWYEREREVEDLLQAILAFGEQAVPYLLETIEHRESVVRRLSALLLGKIKDRRALPALEIALYDLHFEVGETAAQALIGFGREGIEVLIQALQHPEATVRERVVHAMGSLPHPQFTPLLIERLQDSDEAVRLRAIQALARIKDRRALPALQALATDRTNRTLFLAAREAIEEIQK